MPNGTINQRTVTSDATGAFVDATNFDQIGMWKVRATWNGNSIYEASSSAPITIATEDPMT